MSEITPEIVEAHGLSPEEYERVLHALGREPNLVELGIFSVMWSEHCSYKSSRLHLKKLPTEAPWVICGPGENAGVIDIGDGWVAAFKMESHNHPSFIEPYQGAATGVGGILRDIFTMGARPIAVLDSLRFGDPADPRTRRLIEGVVSGIGWYGNCFGVPNLGGEVGFAPEYAGNPLVNAMAVGLVSKRGIFRARAEGVGNPVFYVGAKTGRDGIHGATMASSTFDETAEERRPTVQVGDPFTEKLLLEACLEAMATGAIVGIQDMGAAGLACACSEMPARAGMGMEIEASRVPQRETGMTPYEIMLSESQERMLLVAARGREDDVRRTFAKWELDAVDIGTVTDDGLLRVRFHGAVVAEVPVKALADEAPVYEKPTARPEWQDALAGFDPLSVATGTDASATLLDLLASPGIASKEWVYRQYDQQVGINSLVLPGSDAGVLRIKGTRTGVAVTTDCNARFVYLDPRARSVVDIGALNGRAIYIDERGKVLAYKMTSQCASGSGQFLENIARYLGVAVEEIGPLSKSAQTPEKVSSICAVLAETDVINMVSRGIATPDVLKGIHLSMASRIVKLLKVTGIKEGTALITGGLALDSGLIAAIGEEMVNEKVKVTAVSHPDSIYAGAIGAALWGAFRHQRLNAPAQRAAA